MTTNTEEIKMVGNSSEIVVSKLLKLHEASFSGKENQRFLISMDDIRLLYGLRRLSKAAYLDLVEAAYHRGLYLFDLGTSNRGRLVAVIKGDTVDRWRKVPKKVIADYVSPFDFSAQEIENEIEDEDEE